MCLLWGGDEARAGAAPGGAMGQEWGWGAAAVPGRGRWAGEWLLKADCSLLCPSFPTATQRSCPFVGSQHPR